MTDYSDDYLTWDNTEAVTVTVPGVAAKPVSIAFREDVNRDRQYFNGVLLTGQELLWHIPVALMDSTEIVENTTITDGSDPAVTWLVNSVVKTGVGSSAVEFQCLCVKQR